MGLRKSYTLSSTEAPSGSMIKNFDGTVVKVSAGGTVYLDSEIAALTTSLFTLNTTWQTLTADVDNGDGDYTLETKTIKGISNTEYVIKVNTDISGNLTAADSTILIKAYDSDDTLLETRTITLPAINDTDRDDYVDMSGLLGASYITVDGTMKEAAGDYEATITVDLEDVDEIPAGCIFTIGAENTNVINLGIQLLADDGSALVGRGLIDFYISDDMYGNTCASTVDSLAIGTDGVVIGTDASLNSIRILSESDGDIDINITEATGADVYYGVVILPNGKKIVSDKIIFT